MPPSSRRDDRQPEAFASFMTNGAFSIHTDGTTQRICPGHDRAEPLGWNAAVRAHERQPQERRESGGVAPVPVIGTSPPATSTNDRPLLAAALRPQGEGGGPWRAATSRRTANGERLDGASHAGAAARDRMPCCHGSSRPAAMPKLAKASASVRDGARKSATSRVASRMCCRRAKDRAPGRCSAPTLSATRTACPDDCAGARHRNAAQRFAQRVRVGRSRRTRRDAARAAPRSPAVATAQVEVEQLTAVAQQPVVVQGHRDRNVASGEGVWQPGRQTGQMLDVGDVRPNPVDDRRARQRGERDSGSSPRTSGSRERCC